MIVAYGIDGEGYSFRLGVKSDKPGLLKMPPQTSFDWFSMDRVKQIYPHESAAIDGKWCWTERPLNVR
jgi:hypothetical protein